MSGSTASHPKIASSVRACNYVPHSPVHCILRARSDVDVRLRNDALRWGFTAPSWFAFGEFHRRRAGRGDVILIQAGDSDYLVDAGRAEAGPHVVDFLHGRGVDFLDGIIVSSPDADHIGGFLDVMEAFEVANVHVAGDRKGTLTYNAFLRGVQDEGSKVNELRAGAAEEKSEEYMANGPNTGSLTVLKINHHESNTSSSALFLNNFRPEIAVIQSGADNSYGHPTPETLSRLKEFGAKVFQNYEQGDIIVTIKDENMDVAVIKP